MIVMKKIPVLFIMFFFVITFTNAQEFTSKVTKDILAQNESGIDPGAAAEYLDNNEYIKINYSNEGYFYVTKELSVRVKVYNKDRFDGGTISFYVDDDDMLENFKLITYNLESGSIKKLKVGRRYLTEDNINNNAKRYKIAVPGLKDGTVFEYTYTVKMKRAYTAGRWFFQSDLPVVHSSFTIQYPEYYKYKFVTENIDDYIIPERDEISVIITSPGGNFKMLTKTYSLQLDSLAPLNREPYMPPDNFLLKSVIYELNMFKKVGTKTVYLCTKWADVVNNYVEVFSMMTKPIGSEAKIDEALSQAVGSDTSSLSKLEDIYYYVQSHTEWNGISTTIPRNYIKAFKSKVSSATINYLLVQMLKQAGYNAYPVLIEYRSSGRIYPSLPTISFFDNLIAAVKLDTTVIFMDAATSLIPFGYLPIDELNEYVLPVFRGYSSLKKLETLYNGGKVKIVVSAKLEDGMIKGSLVKRYSGYEAVFTRSEIIDILDREKYFKPDNFDVSNFKINNFDNIKKDLDVKFEFSMPIMNIDSSVFIEPLLGLGMSNPFKASERKYPVDFIYPFEYDYIITIQVPKGYKIKSVPKPARVVMPDDSGSYMFYVQQRDNILQIIVKLAFNKTYFETDQYEILKKFFSAVEDYQHQNIELVK